MSKYQMIYQDLLDKIKQRVIQPNTYLPSENELMKQYGASRDTVRKALNLLLQNGYIQKNKGKGSLVLDMDRIAFPVSGVTSFKELQKTLHGDVETIVNMFLEEEIPNELKEDLYMDSGKIYHIERIRKIDGEKVILDTDYLNGKVVNGLKIEHAKNSLYEYIEKELGLKISFARKEITVVKATQREKQLLDMLDYDLLVCVKSYTYLEDATLFQYTISKHRPDKFRFVDFARRTEL
ncbi:trehalose operon repressor [Longibaculum muris]|uniref:Trehalose operon repressor n=1 Tax=Longibaculum muris TaxID=1796628 RepID=A0A4V2W5Q3_9FIRM|nr:trehalose operon repressor [Longibaculum muris]KXU49949.1 trehalose operon repressor [Candidatus Stoquefichus sp. KLE1796]MBS5368088.1 trehalose operon repressor [Coprobacillus cateniformis]MCR1887500.1 trehalose operon repressor [Longibaculum muris]MED9811782.1 trehalose operon repressor [Longibaculum muris]TCW00783.1 GntR family transcriptional regulator [Longibaculum muris]